MAVTAYLYGQFFDHLAQKRIDLDSDTFKIMLLTSGYSPAQDTHDYIDDVVAASNEVVGAGYTAGGGTLDNVTWGYTAGSNVWKWDADNEAWTTATITARYAVIYDDTAASDPLVGYIDFGADVTSTAGTFTIAFAAAGIFTITVS